uniref:SREBP regulating gene protein n=1 Tax=Schistocephalus solidus TaxID=70667 RepID=A0A0X3Q1L9_SCHSO
MFIASIFQIIKKNLVLSIFLGAVVILLCRIRLQTKATLYPAKPVYNLSWLDHNPLEGSPKVSCRQTSQSAAWVADEEGFYCSRANILPSGCCNHTANSTEPSRYSCFSCSKLDCCSAYERCVACCLNPVNRNRWRITMEAARKADDRNLLIAASVFEFCSFRCRTSSESVAQENTYRDPLNRYCF